MLSLSQKIILTIARYINVEYISDDDSDDEDSKLLQENGEGRYYPIRNLYATCKSFHWLSQLEYIYISTGEFHSNIILCDINGAPSMLYNIDSNGLFGFVDYIHNKENQMYTDTHYHYIKFNGVEHRVDQCDRWSNDCNQCERCVYFDQLQQIIFNQDPQLKYISKQNYDDGIIFIRDKIDNHYIFDDFTPSHHYFIDC